MNRARPGPPAGPPPIEKMPANLVDPDTRRRNIRTALVVLAIAAAFFFGVIAKYW